MKQQNPIFRGIATALITPTTPAGVDYNRLDQLIDWQIAQGINALVICGTTGESSTLTDAEHRQVMAHAIRKIDGRVPVICGTGSNETDYAVELTKSACAAGAAPPRVPAGGRQPIPQGRPFRIRRRPRSILLCLNRNTSRNSLSRQCSIT